MRRPWSLFGLLLLNWGPLLAAEPAKISSVDPLEQPPPVLDRGLVLETSPVEPEDKIVPSLRERLATAARNEPVRVIVTLVEPRLDARSGPPEEADRLLARRIAALEHRFAREARAVGFSPERRLSHLPVVIGWAEALALSNLLAAGVMTFAASGNNGRNAVSFPACLSSAIAVGAVYDADLGPTSFPGLCADPATRADRVACFSNTGEALDLLAPSFCARTPASGGGHDECFGGTSAAAPYAAGVAAQLLGLRRQTTPAELYAALVGTGRPITDARNGVTRNRIDALAAYQLLSGGDPPPPPGPWLRSSALPGFEAKVVIGQSTPGTQEADCIAQTLCASGALAGRPEVFLKVIGPRPNGYLWAQISRFTPSRVEVWLRRIATGQTNHYLLDAVPAASDDVSGLQDREAFPP